MQPSLTRHPKQPLLIPLVRLMSKSVGQSRRGEEGQGGNGRGREGKESWKRREGEWMKVKGRKRREDVWNEGGGGREEVEEEY